MESFIWAIVGGGVLYFLLNKEKNVQDECLKILDNHPIDKEGASKTDIINKLESDFSIKVNYVVLGNNLDKLVSSGKVVTNTAFTGTTYYESKTHKKNREDASL